jgi:hypothetical protein
MREYEHYKEAEGPGQRPQKDVTVRKVQANDRTLGRKEIEIHNDCQAKQEGEDGPRHF